MPRTRIPNADWCTSNDGENALSVEHAILDVLMDIRQELRTIRSILQCRNCLEIPVILRGIRANTAKPKRTRKKPVTRG